VSHGKGQYVIPCGATPDQSSAVNFFSLAQAQESKLVHPTADKKSIGIYLCCGELEWWFSCLGHVYKVWEFFIRNEDGTMVLSTWG